MTHTTTEVTFESAGVACRGSHVRATNEALRGPGGTPIVVMAHGLGGTVDSGLLPFAEALAAAGLDVLAFDYRGFGRSDGEPRQTVSVAGQVADFRAAERHARTLPGVDPGRLVLWGVSLAGGHVFEVAADRDDIAAVVSLTPIVSGASAGRLALRHHRPADLARSTVAGLRSRLRRPVLMPIVGRPGELAALTLEGHYDDYLALAGPSWRNEIDATVGLELGAMKSAAAAGRVRAPMLVQIADFDRSAPPYAALKAAVKARAVVRHYPCDHFDVWPGKERFDLVVAHQVAFLSRAVAP